MGIPQVSPTVTIPPTHGQVVWTLDLKTNRTAALTVQVGVALTVATAIALALLLDLPLDSGWGSGITAVVTVAAVVVYMVGHELTHGAMLWALTRVRPTYAVRLPYLTTGSQALLTRPAAVTVALAPFLLWAVLLSALWLTLPQDGRLTLYVLLALNAAGSVGDAVQAWAFARLAPGSLIRDDGRQTTVFSPSG
ncbi:DUF3267 domain-containing protein [Ornithinimicrobium sufpigmenti]|uniref:DUF3267 domain-containing protein n=1 Tax=Ornithinimicrobium sufpigmenti TaxID=2508882 RepID=UPI001035D4CD|nr:MULTISPECIES: DUF3267 domain-containing protein [unclassified Ornithinimicrobium]